jgi:GTPase KRas protein
LDILDTAGNEDYEMMRDSYLRSGQGFIFLYSIVDADSFKGLEPLIAQMKRVKDAQVQPNHYFRMIIVGNKCDLESSRAVSVEEGRALAEKHQCPFYECSAKSNINVDEVFVELVRLVRQFADHLSSTKGDGKKKGKCNLL